jgi:hypothetical protein
VPQAGFELELCFHLLHAGTAGMRHGARPPVDLNISRWLSTAFRYTELFPHCSELWLGERTEEEPTDQRPAEAPGMVSKRKWVWPGVGEAGHCLCHGHSHRVTSDSRWGRGEEAGTQG